MVKRTCSLLVFAIALCVVYNNLPTTINSAAASVTTFPWSVPVPVSLTVGSSYSPRLARLSDQSLFLVWTDWVDLEVHQPYILYATRPYLGSWSPFSYIPGARGRNPQVAVGQNNTLVVSWDSIKDLVNEVNVAVRSPSGSWSSVQVAGPGGSLNDVAMDSLGGIHLVYYGGQAGVDVGIYYTTKPAGGNWSAPARIFPRSGQGDMAQTHGGYIVIDPQDNIHVLIDHNNTSPEAFYTYKGLLASQWSVPEKISFSPLVRSSTQLITDNTGILHLLWVENDFDNNLVTIFHSYKNPGQAWMKGTAVEKHQNTLIYALSITTGQDNTLHAAWAQYPGYLGYASKSTNKPWSSPALVDMRSGLLNLTNALDIAAFKPNEAVFAWDSGPTFIPPGSEQCGEIWQVTLGGIPPVTCFVDSGGGTIQSADGDTVIVVPPGAVNTGTIVTLTPSAWPDQRGISFIQPFLLTSEDAMDGTPVTTFSLPFTMTITYPASIPLEEGSLKLYTWISGGWQNIPANLNQPAHQISAQSTTTGYFALGGNAFQVFLPCIRK